MWFEIISLYSYTPETIHRSFYLLHFLLRIPEKCNFIPFWSGFVAMLVFFVVGNVFCLLLRFDVASRPKAQKQIPDHHLESFKCKIGTQDCCFRDFNVKKLLLQSFAEVVSCHGIELVILQE